MGNIPRITSPSLSLIKSAKHLNHETYKQNFNAVNGCKGNVDKIARLFGHCYSRMKQGLHIRDENPYATHCVGDKK